MDWFKLKVTPALVKHQQTDSPQAAILRREFANHPSRGLTPARLAAILQSAEQGSMLEQAELFMDMEEKDAHIAAELSKRKMAVKKLDWKLDPPRDASEAEKKNAKLLENLIRDELDVGAIRMDMLDAIGHGYSCIELGWGRNSHGLWAPNQAEHRPPTWFTVAQDDRNGLRLRDPSSVYGVPLQPFGWIAHVHKSRSGYLARTGLHRVLAWPYLYKNYSVRDMAEFLEIYGLPIRIGKYANGTSEEDKRTLLRTVLSIGHNAAGIIPDSMQLELQSVIAQGGADAFKVMIDWCEASQSKAILGGPATGAGGEAATAHWAANINEVRLDIRDDDAQQVDQTLSSCLVYPMAMLNGLFADNRCPTWVSDTQEPDDLALYADALPKLAAAGVKIPARYANLKLKIPEPEEGEDILGAGLQSSLPEGTKAKTEPTARDGGSAAAGMEPAQPAAAALSNNPQPGSAAGQVDNPAPLVDIDPTPVDAQTDLLAGAAGASIKSWVDTIRGKVEKAPSLEALRDDLLNSYADLDSTELTKVMGLAFAAADLAGRFDVDEGG